MKPIHLGKVKGQSWDNREPSANWIVMNLHIFWDLGLRPSGSGLRPVHCNFVVHGRSEAWDRSHTFMPYMRAHARRRPVGGPSAKLMVGDKVHRDQPTPEEPHRYHQGRMCPRRGIEMAMYVTAVCLHGEP